MYFDAKAANVPVPSEYTDIVNTWSELKHIIEDLEHLKLGIDIKQEEIQKGTLDEEIIKNRIKPRLEKELIDVEKKLKTALRIEKKAIDLIESSKGEKVVKKEEPIKKQEVEKPAQTKEVKPVVKETTATDKKIAVKEESAAKKITIKKNEAVSSLNARIDEMGRAAYEIMLQAIEDIFDFKKGKIVGDKDFIHQLNKLTIDVLDLLQSNPKFTGPISQFVKRMQPISDAISVFQKSVNGVKVPDFEVAKKIVIDEIVDKMLNNGLNQHFVVPIRDLIYQNVSSVDGLSLSEARIQIKEYIAGGKDVSGKLGQYVEQTAIQAVDAYSGTINAKLLEQFDYDGLLITGSLIDNSSPQCRYAIEKLNGKITRENWSQVKAIGEKQSGWIEGTTFDNLPENKLHHGCRHNFFPIIIKKAS